MGNLNNKIITEELKQIVVLMNYDRSKTLMEQPDRVMDRRLGITSNNANVLGMSVKDYEREVFGMGDLDAHDVLMGIEISSMLIAPFTGPLAPVFLAISLGAGLADAGVYYFVDDDPHSALIAAALTVIPFVKLGKVLKVSKWFPEKYGAAAVKNLLSRYRAFVKGNKKLKFTDDEIRFISEAGKDLVTKESQLLLKKYTRDAIKKSMNVFLKNKTLKVLVGIIYNILKYAGKTGKFIGTLGLQLGVQYITFDQLYLHYYSNDEDMLEKRERSEFKQIADLISDFSGDIVNWLLGIQNQVTDTLTDEQVTAIQTEILPNNTPIQTTAEYNEMKKREYDEGQANLPGKKITLNMVKSGKADLHYGDQGESVKKIQKMLLSLGIGLGDTGLSPEGADGLFGEGTKDAVKEFQMYADEYGVEDIVSLNKVDGIVGEETLTALMKAIKNKKNNGQ